LLGPGGDVKRVKVEGAVDVSSGAAHAHGRTAVDGVKTESSAFVDPVKPTSAVAGLGLSSSSPLPLSSSDSASSSEPRPLAHVAAAPAADGANLKEGAGSAPMQLSPFLAASQVLSLVASSDAPASAAAAPTPAAASSSPAMLVDTVAESAFEVKSRRAPARIGVAIRITPTAAAPPPHAAK
jgi:hypothetical protein